MKYCENITKNNIKKIYQCKHIKQNKLLRDHVVKKKKLQFFFTKDVSICITKQITKRQS